MLGLVGEVGLHRDQAVAARILGPRRDRAAQRVERPVVAEVLGRAEDRQRKHLGVAPQDFARRVRATVVVDEDLVVARIVLEHLPDAPQQHADRFGFVVRGNAEVEHRQVDGWTGGQVDGNRRSPIYP